MLPGSCEKKSWARVVQDSILLMNMYFVDDVRELWGGYAGLIVPDGVTCKSCKLNGLDGG